MANAFETGGYAFAPVLPRVDEPLAGLKPLSFAGGSQSPIQFKPLAAWNVESPRAELIGQGIASGLGSIAQGIQATYKSKQDREEALRKEGREDRLLSEKNIREDKLLAQKYAQEKGLKELELKLKERKSTVLPSGYDIEESDTTEEDQPISKIPQTLGKATTPSEPVAKINDQVASTLFSNITSPVPLEAAPSVFGQDAINALANMDWSKVSGNLVAATGVMPKTTEIPRIKSDLRTDAADIGKNMGGISPEELSSIERQLSYQPVPQAAPTQQEKKPLASLPVPVPRSGFANEHDARIYMATHENDPTWVAKETPERDPKTGIFKVKWERRDGGKVGKGGEKLLQDQMKIISNVENARGTLADITERLATTTAGPIWGRVVGLNPYDEAAVSVENMVNSLVPSLARGVFGEVGVLTDSDVARYKALIPNMRTDPKVAKQILDDLNRKLDNTKRINLDVWEKAGYDVEKFKQNAQSGTSSTEERSEKQEYESLGKELNAVPDKDRNTYPDWEKKRERYKKLMEKFTSSIYDDPKNKGVVVKGAKMAPKLALENLALPSLGLAGF
jgi:hypothetical protein